MKRKSFISVNRLLLICFFSLNASAFFPVLSRAQAPDAATSRTSVIEQSILREINSFRYREAIGMINKETPSPALEFLKASCYKKLYGLDSAAAVLKRLLLADSTHIKAWAELAEVSALAGNYPESVRSYSRILQMDSANIYFELQRAMIYAKSQQYKAALDGYYKVLETDSSGVILCMAADAHQNLGEDSEAAALYERALKLNPRDLVSLSKIAGIYLRNKQYPEAMAYTGKYRETDSSNALVNRLHGMAKCLNGDNIEAIRVLGKLAEEGDQSFVTNYYLGISEYNEELYEDAFRHLFIPYLLDSTDLTVRLYLGNILCKEKETAKEGIAMLEKGIELMQPDKTELFKYHQALSQGFYRDGKYKKSVAHLQKAYENNPSYTFSFYTIARLYDFHIRNNEQAVKYYREYLIKMKSRYGILEDDPDNGIKIPPISKGYIDDAVRRYQQLREELFMQGIEIPPLNL